MLTAQNTKTTNGTSVMTEIISRLNGMIGTLEAYTTRLEQLGHRMKNTNSPQVDAKGPAPEATGFLSEFESSLQIFGYINDRLMSLAEKMEGII